MSLLNRDVLSGLLFVAAGGAGLWIGQDYAMGTAFRMGPGYFPRLLCSTLVVLGVLIVIKGIMARGELPERLHWRPLLLITSAILAFAGLITTAGLAPAALAVVLIGAAGGSEFRLVEGVLLAVVLSCAAVALFIYGLNMTMPVFNPGALGLPALKL